MSSWIYLDNSFLCQGHWVHHHQHRHQPGLTASCGVETRGGLLSGEVNVLSELKQYDMIFLTMLVDVVGPDDYYDRENISLRHTSAGEWVQHDSMDGASLGHTTPH